MAIVHAAHTVGAARRAVVWQPQVPCLWARCTSGGRSGGRCSSSAHATHATHAHLQAPLAAACAGSTVGRLHCNRSTYGAVLLLWSSVIVMEHMHVAAVLMLVMSVFVAGMSCKLSAQQVLMCAFGQHCASRNPHETRQGFFRCVANHACCRLGRALHRDAFAHRDLRWCTA
jgi:hypothetical protein